MRRPFDRPPRVALGVLWLLDGLLQLQPFMFTRGFARDVISPAGDGQPPVVAAPVHWAAHLIGSHPAPLNAAFAAVQLALGAALLLPRHERAIRPALVASFAWGLGVWYFGEGLGGLLSGHAMLLTGAPGAALLYCVLSVAAWPAGARRDDRRRARWVAYAWAAVWGLGAVYQLLPGQRTAGDVSGAIRDSADAAPAGAASVVHAVAIAVSRHPSLVVALVLVQALVAVSALLPVRFRQLSAVLGGAVALAFWGLGQRLGELFSGQSTDPNAAPLLVVLAVAVGLGARSTLPRIIAVPSPGAAPRGALTGTPERGAA